MKILVTLLSLLNIIFSVSAQAQNEEYYNASAVKCTVEESLFEDSELKPKQTLSVDLSTGTKAVELNGYFISFGYSGSENSLENTTETSVTVRALKPVKTTFYLRADKSQLQ
ncbi:MAG: hypothetical protein V4736_03805, partial [Bdellovibrionota bacterium]